MGCWGEFLFQSDRDYDVIDELKEDAGVELYFFEDAAGPEAARIVLDSGKFIEIFDKVKASGERHETVILTALAMQVGAKIDAAKRTYVKRIYKHAEIMEGAVEQMTAALKDYKDGQCWDFNQSLGLLDTAAAQMAGQGSKTEDTAEKDEEGGGNGEGNTGMGSSVAGAGVHKPASKGSGSKPSVTLSSAAKPSAIKKSVAKGPAAKKTGAKGKENKTTKGLAEM